MVTLGVGNIMLARSPALAGRENGSHLELIMRRNITTGILLALSSLAAASPAIADDLFVGSPLGTVLRADVNDGEFQFGGVCGGPIRSMARAESTLMIGDTNGNVYGLDLNEGGVGYYFTLPGSDNTAIVVHNSTLLISTLEGQVRRVNPANGEVLATYSSPIQVRAMARDNEFLYAAGPEGSVYRAPLATGEFSYFACACLGPINSLAVRAGEVLAADERGTVMKFDRTNGNITGAFFVPGDNSAMTSTPAGDLYIADSTGEVRRVDASAGEVIETLHAGIAIDSIVFVGEPSAGCAADMDHDGIVNSADFFAFLDFFLGGKAAADFNADSHVTSADFFDYLSAFFTPCI
jgi:hypothetical protein